MNKENKMKNNKKAIIVVIVMLITLALTSTVAFFTASSTKETGNIITADINDTLKFQELGKTMNPGLIPLKDEDLLSAANNGCQDKKGYNVCSSYLFSVENISDVAQEIKLSLIPTTNTFENLYYVLIDVTGIDISNGLTTVPDTRNKLEYNNLNSIEMKNNINLNSGVTKTYELLLYIKGLEIDQTAMDADKSFGAGIRVDSITTGKYITKNFGESCWAVENGNKLTAFHGINDDGGVNESCTGYVEKDEAGLYSVNIPSNVGGNEITTLGNNLFNSIDSFDSEGNPIINNYTNIKQIDVAEGITIIEDGLTNDETNEIFGTFIGIGYDLYAGHINESRELVVNLPYSLKYIGSFAFYTSALKEITIPSSVESIGVKAFESNEILTKVSFMGAEDNISNLTTIGQSAFQYSNLSHDESNPLLIPSSVESIGEYAFQSNSNLTKVTFMGADDNTSKLKTIGDSAFDSCNLTYTESNPLLLPSSITSMGENVFFSNPNLLAIKFTGDTTGFPNSWNQINHFGTTDKFATIITE